MDVVIQLKEKITEKYKSGWTREDFQGPKDPQDLSQKHTQKMKHFPRANCLHTLNDCARRKIV